LESSNEANGMDAIKVIHDAAGHTLTIWLDDPAKEAMCEETTDDVVLMKDAAGRVIGFEVLNYRPATADARVLVEAVVHPSST
jgi:Protein of unknown function (DUF2283)